MARVFTRTIKSSNIGIVKYTTGDGTHNKGYLFGSTNTIRSSTTKAPISNIVASSADMSKPWAVTIPIPKGMRWKGFVSVETATGAVTAVYYNDGVPYDGDDAGDTDKKIIIGPNATDTGGAIANDTDITFVYEVYDDTTLNATMFAVSNHSDASGHTVTIKFRLNEGSAVKTVLLHAGDSLAGPFSEVEIDAISNPSASAIVHYQEH